jgi:antirestriction protein ArdC
MTQDEKVTVYQVITDRILDLLDKGVVPWRKGWTGGGTSRMPRNIYGRAYRGINLWLLASLGYESPYFLTYKQAQKLGGKVRKGERGMSVVLWQPFEKQVMDENTGKMVTKKWLNLRYYTVFNIAQTEGCKFPKKVNESLNPTTTAEPVDEFNSIEAAEAIFDGWTGKPVVAYDGNDRAYYVPSEDVVHLPRKAQFRGSGEYYSTLFHELAHSTGHKSRLNRDQTGYFGSHNYGTEELTAEFTAAFLNGMAGLDPEVIENNAAYINSWKNTIKADPKLVVTAAGRAQKAADLILGTKVEVEDTGVEAAEAA